MLKEIATLCLLILLGTKAIAALENELPVKRQSTPKPQTKPTPLQSPAPRPAPAQKIPQPGQVFKDCTNCSEMVIIPAGTTGGQTDGGSTKGGADLQISCTESFETYLRTLPNFSSASIKNVVNNARNDAGMLLQDTKSGKITQQYNTEYQRFIREMKDSGRTAVENHEKLSMSGRSKSEICNPLEGSQGMAWAATQIGVAFFTWALNVAHCSLGQKEAIPIPVFCPF